LKLSIEKAIYGGSGLARADGKAIFVPFTLPGEEVEAEIVSDKGGFATAELQSVLEPSPARTNPPCLYFGKCGGCHYQHANYATQIDMKLAILRESLERARIQEIPTITPVTAEPLGYRNRIRLHIQKNPFSLCYKFRKSHTNFPVDACPIASPILQRAIDTLNREGKSLNLVESVTEIELFTNPDESAVLVSLWTDHPAPAAKQIVDKLSPPLRQMFPQIQAIGIFAIERNRTTNKLLAHTGSGFLTYASKDRHYRVGLGSFFREVSPGTSTLASAFSPYPSRTISPKSPPSNPHPPPSATSVKISATPNIASSPPKPLRSSARPSRNTTPSPTSSSSTRPAPASSATSPMPSRKSARARLLTFLAIPLPSAATSPR